MIRPSQILKADPIETERGEHWDTRAACLDEDPELFHLKGDGKTTSPDKRLQIAEAKAVCHRCPVIAPCLEEAMANNLGGILGGTTDEERRLERQRRRKAARKRRALEEKTQ